MYRKHLMYLQAAVLAALMAVMSCSILEPEEEGDGDDGPIVTQSTSITANTTWTSDKVYIVEGSIGISNATLTIEAGTIIKFAENAELAINAGGGLIADGTTDTIIFTGTTPQAGWWDYIWFNDNSVNANCRLINCRIEYGGGYSSSYGMVYCDNASPTITNCLIRNAQYNGVDLYGTSKPTFKNNTITGCGTAMEANFANAICIDTCIFSTNTNNYIFLNSATLAEHGTLTRQSVPYMLKNGYIENATLTIEPGTMIWMDENSEISVNDGAGLMAQGTVADQITFTSRYPQAGNWDYIWFDDNSVDAACILDHCAISYGGGYSSSYGMVYCDNASPTITNCTISHSQYNGVDFNGTSMPVFKNNAISDCQTPIETNFANTSAVDTCIFTGNTNNFIRVNSSTITSDASWTKQSIPYMVRDGYINDATLTIAPGTVIMMDASAEITVNAGGALYADGTADSIIFTGRYPQNGYWDYLWFNDDCASVNCMLKSCRIEYGGGYSSSYAMVYCEDVDPNITGCLIRNSESYGIYAPLDANIAANNTITGNDIDDVQP